MSWRITDPSLNAYLKELEDRLRAVESGRAFDGLVSMGELKVGALKVTAVPSSKDSKGVWTHPSEPAQPTAAHLAAPTTPGPTLLLFTDTATGRSFRFDPTKFLDLSYNVYSEAIFSFPGTLVTGASQRITPRAIGAGSLQLLDVVVLLDTAGSTETIVALTKNNEVEPMATISIAAGATVASATLKNRSPLDLTMAGTPIGELRDFIRASVVTAGTGAGELTVQVGMRSRYRLLTEQ